MRLVLTIRRIIYSGLLIMFITACSSTSNQKIAATLAAQRADMLSNIVPVSMKGYNIIRAKANGTNIELMLLYFGNSNITPTVLAYSLKKAYCLDNEITWLMKQGVEYDLLFRDNRGHSVFECKINHHDCVQ
ncbi:type II secretion system pilot lipoprotein GspS-beta [Candidatus Enterovibrio altilux]|nr:type II secretion system pilot lipoprotein GspS-beta [Candidatus Enterovibrio luxaltus]